MIQKEVGKSQPLIRRVVDPVEAVLSNVELDPFGAWNRVVKSNSLYILPIKSFTKRKDLEGGSPGLVVKGRDSCSEGRGFESRHRILDGHFFLIYLL